MVAGNAMVVEDQYHFRKGLVRMIEQSKQKWQVVSEASNGLDALRLLEMHKPDLILTDIRMPAMNGLEFLTELRKQHPDTLVIILTGYKNFEYAQAAIKLGVMDFLVKPCTIEDVRQVLERAAERFVSRQSAGGVASEALRRREAAEHALAAQFPLGEQAEERSVAQLNKAVSYIHMHYAGDCRLTEVAEHVQLNASYFSLMFKKAMGESFTAYVTRYRLDKALELLCHSELKVLEIAAAIGFDEPNYFTNVFRQRYKISPKEYRRRFVEGKL